MELTKARVGRLQKMSVLMIGLLPSFAFAGNFALVDMMQSLIDLLTSDIARVAFVLAIVGVGYGWLYLGRIPKERAVGAIVGIGLIFSASYIAQRLGVSY